MLTQQQLSAKTAARSLCTYGARLTAEREHLPADDLPRLQPGIAGYGVAGDTVRIYTLADGPTEDIPDELEGLRTETISTSGFRLHAPLRQTLLSTIPCGVSIGHFNITAGTLGCLVDIAGERHILSNNHVLADSNGGTAADDILQPGPADGTSSNPARRIGGLADYEPIDFTGDNRIDAAVASLDDNASVTPDIMTLGLASSSPVAPILGAPVAKHGRTTGLTFGNIVDVSFDGYVNFGTQLQPRLVWFENQIGIQGDTTRFSGGGDSGSLVVDRPGSHPVGLLFAGDDTQTLANPIDLVLNRFGATVVGK